MPAPELEKREAAPVAPARQHVTWRKRALLPGFLVVLLLGTWLWFRQAALDPVSEGALSGGRVPEALWQQVRLTVIATFFVLVVGVPLGILLTRPVFRRAAPVVLAVARAGGGAIPAVGLLAVLVVWLGTGMTAVLIALVLCALLPVVSHTVTGLLATDPTLLEAARGIGMSPAGVLWHVELPLTVPRLLTGARTALVLNAGTATLAGFGGGGGLGALIATGIREERTPVLVVGSVLTVALALLVDWVGSMGEVGWSGGGEVEE
ncbi:ABC transporter permease [Streptomyces sp. NPDC049687]|uniref:ABC transporter permease n=1 Tax=Streptomyces sp. NPDC049687 TaxID=3365596 RepID=UPI0037BB9871